MSHRVESWLTLRLGACPARRLYVIIDGYVLRAFVSEPDTAHLEDITAAEAIFDLRYAGALTPVDAYKPPPHGPCQLHAKEEKRRTPAKAITFEPDEHHVGGHAWLTHLASALPHNAVAPALRSWRNETKVLALIAHHSMRARSLVLARLLRARTSARLSHTSCACSCIVRAVCAQAFRQGLAQGRG
ncbi:hypothetical protein OAO87_04035 [bacterium]|nr:hypothetical protein [bacterium]